ncbi:MAG: DUF262 domain-containing protein [Patescibacteria group bacterium]|nr:DUF262 domain-containing protein [Patescibacteria group bacterium]
MQNPKIKTIGINDFREWSNKKELILAPEFQRRKVWSIKARSYLVDTILNGFPVPSIHIRQKIDLRTKKTIREVVDGQQRIRAILDYINDEFSLLKVHSKAYGGLKFSGLSNRLKKKFLEYDLPVVFLVGANDRNVLEVFGRINSYTIVLNAQEKLNADFSGKFKQIVFQLGRDHLEFWRQNKILTHQSIMRMKEAELCSELVIAMIAGLQDRKKIKSYYEKYDDDFVQEKKVVVRFKKCIDMIARIFGDSLAKSKFRKTTLFYSLFCAIYDITYGFPKSTTPRVQIKTNKYRAIRKALSILEKELVVEEPSSKYLKFIDASTRHTTDLSRRRIRHKTIIREILEELNVN